MHMCTLSHRSAFTMCELERKIDVIGMELFQIEYRKLINFEKTICHILSRCVKKRVKIHLVGDILLHEQYNN